MMRWQRALLWPEGAAADADDASLGAMSPTGLPWIFAPRTDPDAMARYVDYHAVDHVWHGVVGAGVGGALTDTLGYMDTAHDKIQAIFERSITQALREKMDARPV